MVCVLLPFLERHPAVVEYMALHHPLTRRDASTCRRGIREEHGVLIGIAGTEEQHGIKAW